MQIIASGELCEVRDTKIMSGKNAGEMRRYAKFLCDGRLFPVELPEGVSSEPGYREHEIDVVWGDTYKDGKYVKYYRAILLN